MSSELTYKSPSIWEGQVNQEVCRLKDKAKHWVLIFKNGVIVIIPKEKV